PDFRLSGRLAAETNTVNGVVLKYSEPPEARHPRDSKWRIYVFKDGKDIDMYHVDTASGYLFGRDRKVADIPTDHPSCSSQHAVLQYRLVGSNTIKPYIIDLSSTNGTFLNSEKIAPQRYVELRSEDVIMFGFSTREYVLLRE
ncbi:SMAD/FHA domain-containing protein, partial [Coemansia spiralis]